MLKAGVLKALDNVIADPNLGIIDSIIVGYLWYSSVHQLQVVLQHHMK